MALKAAARKRIPRSSFVYPPGTKVGGKTGKYPINTAKRARAALSYSARSSTAGSYSTVKRAVAKRYPSIGKR
jgi:hypothetical protein